MPHLTLYLSPNFPAIPPERLAEFFGRCHAEMVQILPADIRQCKSRLLRYEQIWLGDGNDPRAVFAHLDVRVLSGRSAETLDHLSRTLHSLAKADLGLWLAGENTLILTCEVSELSPHYVR